MLGVSRLRVPSRWVWRGEADLPRSRSGRHGQQEYIDHLEGRDAGETLVTVLGELARKLPSPD
jgi:hypothetical protein